MTCLHWAAGRGYEDIVEILLKNGAKVDSTDKVALHLACLFATRYTRHY